MGIVRYLISKGADPNTQGEHGSPLQSAIFYKNLDVAQVLLNNSRTDVNLDTGLYGNALQQALLSNAVDISYILQNILFVAKLPLSLFTTVAI